MLLPARRHLLPAALFLLCALVAPVFAFGGTARAPVRFVARVDGAGTASTPADRAFPLDGPAFAKARDIALQHWAGAQPCSGQVTISYGPLDPGTNATASWSNPTDAWNNVAANFNCTIIVNPQADYDFPKLCTVLTHEFGHLLGQQHAAQPGLLMSAIYSDPLPECVAGDPNPSASSSTVTAQGRAAAATATTSSSAASKPKAKTTVKTKAKAPSSRSKSRGKAAKKRALVKKRKAAARSCIRRFRAAGKSSRQAVRRCSSAKAARKFARR